jgi:hypothetical protein
MSHIKVYTITVTFDAFSGRVSRHGTAEEIQEFADFLIEVQMIPQEMTELEVADAHAEAMRDLKTTGRFEGYGIRIHIEE